MSNNLTVVAYKPEHLEQIEVRSCYVAGECPKTIMTTAVTFLYGDKVLAILGAFPFVPGVLHLWGLISDHVKECPKEFHEEVVKIMNWYVINEKPRRLQMDVHASYEVGCRWAERLGFEREGLMKGWGPNGEGFYLYGKAITWQQ